MANKTFIYSPIIFLFLIGIQTIRSQVFQDKTMVKNDANQGRGSTDKHLFRWGYFLGFNNYDFNFDYNTNSLPDIETVRSTGFNVGIIGNMRITDFFDLRLEPGIVISTRELKYSEDYFIPSGITPSKKDLFREVKATYIHIPLLLKCSAKRINNFKPFIVGGFSTAINLASNEENPDDNSKGEFRSITNPLFYELGFGIDFYLHNFKFTPSIRGIFSLNDELIRDDDPNSPWTGNVASMKTRGVFINFTFQ